MRGLLKNNIYATLSGGKLFGILCALWEVLRSALSVPVPVDWLRLTGIVGFTVCALIVVQKEFTSKWGKYKLTLPVRRADIIKSQFWNHLIWLLSGLFFAEPESAYRGFFMAVSLTSLLDILMLFALCVSISLFLGALYFPLLSNRRRTRRNHSWGLHCSAAFVMDWGLISILNDLFTWEDCIY